MGSASQEFDEQLFTRKLSEPARQMHKESEASVKAAQLGASGPAKLGGTALIRIKDGELAVSRKWLETVDRICREVWQMQGKTITPEFVREILVPKAITAIETRAGLTQSCVGNIAARTHEDPHGAWHRLAMEVNTLKAEVANRYEIEAQEIEYRNAVSKPIAGLSGSEWQEFHNAFMQLASEEERIVRAAPKDRLLHAYCTYKEHPEVLEKGKPEQGRFCLLKVPETGLWKISDGVSENFYERFRALAARAGVTLGSPKDADPEDFWLHRLFLNLRENNSKQLFAASMEGGMILRVCEASATFCSRLERMALETSASAPERDANQEDDRNLFVRPILDKQGWSILDWANYSGVDFHTANNYLKGQTKPYKSTRTKLAKSLGVEVQKLPS